MCKYNLKNEKDVRAYVTACEAAALVPILACRDFYKTMVNANQDNFCSKKQLKKRTKKSHQML